MSSADASRKPNRLASEKSPYLRQHALNPVDWYPWGEEAFARARRENKPIFLSVGYSTCHWCHVMERESFESDEIAEIMNRYFVNVKVDREERPDVDRVYMTFVQAATGGGGWPMSVFLTPELEPFFGGTYFPPDDRYGRPGFPKLLELLHKAWTERRDDVVKSGANVIQQLRRMASEAAPPELLGPDILSLAQRVFAGAYDDKFGGFGQAPKFPRPVVFNFLYRHFAKTGDLRSAEMCLVSLVHMARGGMYDHLGGGFHRYSVDRHWHVPHFEKMLYDQAQLVGSYLEAWQLTKDPFFSRVARETCDYVLRDLTHAEGGFFSAEDADSPVGAPDGQRKEGAFYVWRKPEIDALLGADAEVFGRHYGVLSEGNADDPHGELTGTNILHAMRNEEGDADLLARARAVLFAARDKRPRPHRDEKVLCGWNGMMIGALARASQVLEEPRYLEAAQRAARFLMGTLWNGGVLHRRWCDGEVAVPAYLEDHAHAVAGLIDLYEADFDLGWLRLAETLTERQIELFHDAENGGFWSTSGKDPSVLVRMKEDYDGAEPAGNSVAARNLFRLAEHLGKDAWARMAEGTLRGFSSRLKETPHALPQMMCAFQWSLEPPVEIVIAAARREPAAPMLHAVHQAFLPDRILRLLTDDARAALSANLPFLAEMKAGASATAYVCKNRACEHPTSDPKNLLTLLGPRTLPDD